MKDFIIMYFKTSQREDIPFWQTNKYETVLPYLLKLLLARHLAGLLIKATHQSDIKLYVCFCGQLDNFWIIANYQSILCGVEWLLETSLPLPQYRSDIMEKGEALFKQYRQESKQLVTSLPSQYEYLTKNYADQFQFYENKADVL